MLQSCFNALKMYKLILPFLLISLVFSEDELPKDLSDPVLYCEGCYGVMFEIDAFMVRLKHEKLETRVKKALDQVCHTDHLRKYVFSPPKMTKVKQKTPFFESCIHFNVHYFIYNFRCATQWWDIFDKTWSFMSKTSTWVANLSVIHMTWSKTFALTESPRHVVRTRKFPVLSAKRSSYEKSKKPRKIKSFE